MQDIFKDVRFLILLALYQTVLPNIREWDISILFGYPVPKESDGLSLTNILFLPAWLFLVLSEVAKILILLCQQTWTWKKRILAGISSILYPAYLYQKEADLANELHHLLGQNKSDKVRSDIVEVEEKKRSSAVMKSHLRSAENSLEHMPLILISISLLIHSGHTREAIGDNVTFIAVSTLISGLSLIRGQVRGDTSTELIQYFHAHNLSDVLGRELKERCHWHCGPMYSRGILHRGYI